MTDTTPDSPRKSYRLPFTVPTWMIYTLVFMVVASWIPLALIAKARSMKSAKPRIHIIQDMDAQPRFGPQSFAGADAAQLNEDYGDLFLDKRGMRPPVPGTVARNEHAGPQDDDHYFRGYKTNDELKPILKKLGDEPDAAEISDPATFLGGLPGAVKLDRALLERGRQRYDIYCALCHGTAGYGDGSVQRYITSANETAAMLGTPAAPAAGWVPPRNLHQPNVVDYNEGRLFHIVSEGAGTMRGYKQQISVADRWAIVAYVKVLQASQNVSAQYAATLGVKVDDFDIGPKPVKKIVEVGDEAAPDPDWIDDPAMIAKGKTLFATKICSTCHQADPAIPAPAGDALKATKFIGKFWHEKRTVTKGPGGEEMDVFFDWPYVDESIANPMAKIVKGSVPGMAPLPTTEDERKALAAYIKSLSE